MSPPINEKQINSNIPEVQSEESIDFCGRKWTPREYAGYKFLLASFCMFGCAVGIAGLSCLRISFLTESVVTPIYFGLCTAAIFPFVFGGVKLWPVENNGDGNFDWNLALSHPETMGYRDRMDRIQK